MKSACRLLALALLLSILVPSRVHAFSTSSCAGGGVSWASSCDEASWSCGGTFCNVLTGERRLALGVLSTTDSRMVPFDMRVNLESNEVFLVQDSVVTAFFQTDPGFRSQLRANDTWTGFSSPGTVFLHDPILLTFFTVSIYYAENDPSETSSIVFAFVPPFYSDTDDLRDRMAANFHIPKKPHNNNN